MRDFPAWLKCRKGATAIEYGLIVGGIAIACLAAIMLMGDDIGIIFDALADTSEDATGDVVEDLAAAEE